MLSDLLATDLTDWMEKAPDGAPRRIVLWLDPEMQFARIVSHLESELAQRGVRLLIYEPEAGNGQFSLKLALLRLEAAKNDRAVVYLPGFRKEALEAQPDGRPPDLWALYDYRFKGCVWGRGDLWQAGTVPEPFTLLEWLEQQGLRVASENTAKTLCAGGKDSLLARYTEHKRQIPIRDWPRPLRLSDVREALAGDPRDALRRLLAAPSNEVKQWGDERSLVLEQVAQEYGLTLPHPNPLPEGEGTGVTAEELADAFAVQIALTEAWDAFGRPADFPFMSRLPVKMEQRQRLAQFLREDIVSHTELAPRFRERMLRVEVGYSLATWAENRPGQPSGLPLLARSRWQQFLNRFNEVSASSWKDARDLVLAERQAISIAASSPWERLESIENRDTHWCVLAELASLAEKADNATDEAINQNSVADLVSLYTSSWWSNDRVHLRIRASCSKVHGLEQVRRTTDLAYFEYAVRVNERFASLIESDPTWPPAGTTGIESLRQELWKTNVNRQAVIISDACRWDFAETVKERLTTDHCTLTPVFATLPTETEFGMTAMLPLGSEPISVEFGSSRPTIKQNDGPNLATRDGRREYLKKALTGSGKPLVEFMDMETLLKGAKVPTSLLVVVFDNNIDEQGHKGAEELPTLVDQFIGNLKRTIELLHAAGIGAVHLVTDHGFLLLPPEEVDGQGTPQVLPSQAFVKDVRWAALKPDAPVTDVIRIPLPLAPNDVLLGLCRGVRTLVKAQPYLHGGLSLQECVLPHLVSKHSMPQVRLGLDLQVSSARLTGGTVPVILRPAFGGPQPPLGGIQPIVVRLQVESQPAKGKQALQVTEPIGIQVRPDAEELRPAVYLKEGLGLKAGQDLLLKATDAETGKDLGSLKLTLLVDWD